MAKQKIVLTIELEDEGPEDPGMSVDVKFVFEPELPNPSLQTPSVLQQVTISVVQDVLNAIKGEDGEFNGDPSVN